MSEFNGSWVNSVDKRLDSLEARISDLERAISSSKKTKTAISGSSKGPTNAVLKLIQDGFLNEPILVKEIVQELNRQGYYYTIQVIDEVLRRMNRNRILTRTGKRGKWKYTVRK